MDGDFLHAINGDWDSLLTVMRENRQVAQRTDASGMTVLHWVCLHQDAPTDIVVKVVFGNPYAVHMRNDAGHLPIDLAIQAECGERILEVLRAAAHGSHRPEDDGGELHQHDLMGKDDGEPTTETIDYQLPYNNHTILHDDIRDGSDYQPHQNHTYYDESDDEVDEDELEYQQHHRHYQPQPFQRKGRLERSVSDQDSFYDPPQGNYGGTSVYGVFGVGPDRDRGNTLSRSDPHVKSLLTEQRLRERENDLISIATADDSMPLGLFDPSKGPPDMSMMSGFQINEDVKSSHVNVNISSRSMGGAGPRSKTAFPPRWKQSRMCHVCACGFSLVKRRHHCRNCGQSVCSQHSTNRVSLPKFALSEPQRVCDQCFLSGDHIMVPGGSTPSIASSYQSLPAQLQREQLQHPFQTSQQYQMQFQHTR
ncbi:hypothetical protein PC129_g22753 [Phytophthora cactorum]|uniref:FYVE-type domain-containing protein n=1 Tax=Phytophthora cactorum TaxID=29920 RepID=A0A329RV11_9STRA|nr:hypothetical protein Pcac1_g22254 [Phytophthora cactorum]KAG2793724.1 hypothetical protein PC111_g22918 [Phytophthora cactorum]KAG2794133.1 hypothetical protein PC112_g23158 [Phytophthora cactorum]KAG2816675.1 hypothetical protein PC113_g23063 [Phytophthora cactorum]KAG2873443.1 hypothetical protein PC114_g25846 [Phytophthora cactorum]